jgi:putative glycosyltransferase (TIGR04372 family)
VLAQLRKLLGKVRDKGARGCLAAAGRRLRRVLAPPARLGRRALRGVKGLPGRWRQRLAAAAARARLEAAGFRLGVWLLRTLRVRFLGDWALQPSWAWLGHLAAEPDCFIKEGRLGLRPKYRGVILCPEQPANRCLLDYWRRYLWVVTSPRWCQRLARFSALPELRYSVHPYVNAINETARYGVIQAGHAARPPLLRLSRRHRASGEAGLRQLGVPAGAWYVCVHCRESGYDNHTSYHAQRNCQIDNYRLALEAIRARGGWCIRMGDSTMRPLPPLPGVIDYAHSPLRCDWMDVFLCATARFLLASASGLCVVANVFGTPSAIANQALPSIMYPYGAGDLLIPKLLWSGRLGRYLTFPEVAGGHFAVARFAQCLHRAGLEAHDNTPEDIRDLALELLDELEGTFVETDEDRRLQEAYRRLVRPGHYPHGAVSRIGRLFLRKYRHLVEPAAPPAPWLTEAADCPCLAPGFDPSRQQAA